MSACRNRFHGDSFALGVRGFIACGVFVQRAVDFQHSAFRQGKYIDADVYLLFRLFNFTARLRVGCNNKARKAVSFKRHRSALHRGLNLIDRTVLLYVIYRIRFACVDIRHGNGNFYFAARLYLCAVPDYRNIIDINFTVCVVILFGNRLECDKFIRPDHFYRF